MTTLKWFAGGSERRCEAITIIDHLLEDIKDTSQLTPLKNQLVSYKRRLEDLSLIHISEPTRLHKVSRMPSSA